MDRSTEIAYSVVSMSDISLYLKNFVSCGQRTRNVWHGVQGNRELWPGKSVPAATSVLLSPQNLIEL